MDGEGPNPVATGLGGNETGDQNRWFVFLDPLDAGAWLCPEPFCWEGPLTETGGGAPRISLCAVPGTLTLGV